MIIHGMGHDLPREVWPRTFADEIADNAERTAEGALAKQPA